MAASDISGTISHPIWALRVSNSNELFSLNIVDREKDVKEISCLDHAKASH